MPEPETDPQTETWLHSITLFDHVPANSQVPVHVTQMILLNGQDPSHFNIVIPTHEPVEVTSGRMEPTVVSLVVNADAIEWRDNPAADQPDQPDRYPHTLGGLRVLSPLPTEQEHRWEQTEDEGSWVRCHLFLHSVTFASGGPLGGE